MKVYIKELGKDKENIQTLNTSSDKFFMPRIGDSILVSYTVVKIEWTSFRSGNETAILWVIKKEDNLVKISIIQFKSSIWITKTELLIEKEVERTQLSKVLIPTIGERIEVNDKLYKVVKVARLGDLLSPTELKIGVLKL